MSETNNNVNPEELVEEINYTVEQAEMIIPPTDAGLRWAGMAADAKATRDLINQMWNSVLVNGKSQLPHGAGIILYAGDIKMTDDVAAQTIREAIESLSERGAEQIMYDPVNLISVADAIAEINTNLETGIPEDEIDDIFTEVFDTED